MKQNWFLAIMLSAAWLVSPHLAHAAKKKPPKPAPAAAPAPQPAPAPAQPAPAPAQPAPAPAAQPAPAQAQPAPAPAAKPTEIKAAPAEPAKTRSSSSSSSLDFDLLDKKPQADAAEIKKAEETEMLAKRRRTMLLVHQALGFTLMGVATANTALGTLNYWDKFGGGGFNNTFEIAHLISSMVTTGVFATNGLLALFTPDPYDKPGRWDSARFHRIFMASATVGMAAQIVLGFISASRLGQIDQRDFARIHLGVGYATYALTMAGGLLYLF